MVVAQTIARSLARSVIPALFAQGYSATAALRYFRIIGPGLRTKLWHASWREITGAKKLERVYRFIPRKYRLSYAMMAPTETFQQREFKYVFDVHGREAETGLYKVRTVSYGSEERLSPDAVEAEMANVLAMESERYIEELDFIPDSVDLIVVYHKVAIF